jgi:signal transduction histidine kinase
VVGRLPVEVENSAYRVIEEMLCALNEVAALRVSLSVENDMLRVVVRSCHQGTRPYFNADEQLDCGLATARARLELIGGTLLVDSGTNDDIGLIAEIPLARTPSDTHSGVSVGGDPLERVDEVSAGG